MKIAQLISLAHISFFLFLSFFLITSCSTTKEVSFKSGEPAQVSLMPLGDKGQNEELVGTTPVSVPTEKAVGKIAKVSAAGKEPQYFVVVDPSSEKTDLVVTLSAAKIEGLNRDSSKDQTNLLIRLLMNAYKSLSGRRFQQAIELADKAAAINAQVAGPLVIKGLALHQMGNTEAARTALAQAKILDPGDADIEKLMVSLNLN